MRQPRARLAKRVARYVHLTAIGLSVAVVWLGSGWGVVLLLVALLVDYILFKLAIRDDSVSLIAKLVLLSVCALTFYSLMWPQSSKQQQQQQRHLHLDQDQQQQQLSVHRNVRTRHVRQKSSTASKHKKGRSSDAKDGEKLGQDGGGKGVPPLESQELLASVFEGVATLPVVDFPDLRYRPPSEVRRVLKRVFEELPADGFVQGMKNPCWKADADLSRMLNAREEAVKKKHRKAHMRRGGGIGRGEEEKEEEEVMGSAARGEADSTHCLPYAYVLGQPKCGTSDLFERLKMHPHIKVPSRKEVRWFTRGEFTRSRLDMELARDGGGGGGEASSSSSHQLLGPGSSIYSFTKSFHNAVNSIVAHPSTHITIDGGPHTLWWPTQSPDGTVLEEPIPTPQILREMQPHAKFIITLSDPVKRTYSDYYFLDDNLRVHRPGDAGSSGGKSSKHFHERVKEQIEGMNACIDEQLVALTAAAAPAAHKAAWFRASQICAHNRHKFAVAGWGRLAIGMYAEFFEKWLEHFPPSQFLVVRLEDYDKDPRAYMEKIFAFLGLSDPSFSDWSAVLNKHRANEYHAHREPILQETEELMRAFYKPHNQVLSELLGKDERFLWTDAATTLRDSQLASSASASASSSTGAGGSSSDGGGEARTDSRKAQVISDRTAAAKSAHDALLAKWHKTYNETLLKSSSGHPTGLSRHGKSRHERRGGSTDDNNDKVTIDSMLKNKGGEEQSFLLKPQSLDLEGLPQPESDEFNLWLRDGRHIARDKPLIDEQDAAEQLCLAAFALDLAALKFLLYEKGVPGNLINYKESNRNAFHCLSLVHVMADAHGKSQVFATLKGRPNWLAQYVDPPLPTQSHSVLARDVIDGVSGAVEKVALWLIRAGCPVDLVDKGGNTPLHHAAAGGMLGLSAFLVAQGADVNRPNREGRTPMLYSCSYGHAAIAEVLLKAGADLDRADKFGTTSRQIVEAPGPVLAGDALKFLNISQRPARQIHRQLHPERKPGAKGGWKGGTGGWGTDRLAGYETDMGCEVDQYWAHEITGEELFEKYISRMAPVLIRGLIDDWEAVQRYSLANLTAEHGDLRVQVSDIPYSEKFGGSHREDKLLSEYIDEVRNHRIKGGSHPWYVFKGNRVPVDSEKTESLVQYHWTPTPHVVQHAIEFLNPPTARGYTGPKSREIFVNAQWAFGGEGTGAPVHYHNTAWNALVYGAKKWIIYPPHSMIMSNRQILEYFETDKQTFEARGVHSLSCVQTAGDVIIVPEIWGHGVLNIQESVAVATESKANHWRLKPASDIVSKLPRAGSL